MWTLIFTKEAQKDARKITQAGLKQKTEALLELLKQNPLQNPPSMRSLWGTSKGLIPAASISCTAWCTRFIRKKKWLKFYECGLITNNFSRFRSRASL